MLVVLSFCWQFWPKLFQNKFKKQSQCEKMSKVYVRVMLTVEKGPEVNFGFFFVFFWISFRFLGFPCVFLLFLVFSFHFARFSCEF